MPRRKGLGIPPKRRVKLDESLDPNYTNIKASDTIGLKTLTNGHAGHSEEEPKRELHNGDRSQSSSPKSAEENTAKNGSASEDDKIRYTHKKFKKMATIAPFNYVSTPSSPPVVKPPPLSLKMPTSSPSTPLPCSPSTEYLHRHISKLISENQAIVETSDPYLSKKFYQRTKQEKEPASPRSHKVSPRTVYTSPPTQWHPPVLTPTPSSPLLVSSASYEAAYIKSLMSSPSPSSPLSSASSSSSGTEFTWPRKPQQSAQQLQHAFPYSTAALLSAAKQQAESKLASALLRPVPMSSSQPPLEEDPSCQPLNLTVKTNHVDSKSQSRKRSFNSSFPEETSSSQERVKFSVDSIVSEKPKPLFISPEVDLKSQMSVHRPLPLNNIQQTMLMYNSMDPKANLLLSESLLVQHRINRGGVDVDASFHQSQLRKARSPMKVFPPLPSPGPLLGTTPLVDTRSHIPTLRSLEKLSQSPMGQQHAFQMYGGEVQIRDAIGDPKTLRIESNKLKSSDHSKSMATVVTMAKSAELNSGGTTILQVPQPSESAQVPKVNHDSLKNNNTLLIPVMYKPPTPTVPLAGSPHVMTSSISAGPHTSIASAYNGGVLTLLHAGKAIPHVPGIPGPWEDSRTEMKSKLSAEVKPILQKPSTEPKLVKNGRIPALAEAKSPRQADETSQSQSLPSSAIHPLTPHLILTTSTSADPGAEDDKTSRFLRPSSLPLKPGTYTPKRHLSSTASQSLVSPETPRPRKGYGQLYLNGHAYTYLGLKCSTRLFFCTLNKPQPLYAPLSPEHCKVSMYSNWKICSEVDPNPFGLNPAKMMACYCSSTRPREYTVAQSKTDLQVTHSSYWSKKKKKKKEAPSGGESEKEGEGKEDMKDKPSQGAAESEPKSPVDSSIPVGALVPEVVIKEDEVQSTQPKSSEEKPKRRKIFTGGFESNEDYIYIRGRGRGRFVCEECGIRCRKPSMLKKHIKTHSDVRLYTCTFCSFSFKTKGNLTKHMKSKAHFKKCVELGVSPMPSNEDLSGDEKQEYRNSHSSESNTEPGESDDDDENDDDDDDDDCSDDDIDDETDGSDTEENEDEDDERINSELEHDVAHSLLSLARMPLQATSTSTTNVVTSTFCSTMSSTITTMSSTVSTMSTTTMITVPSATAVSVLPTVRDSEKAATSILPPTSPNSSHLKPRAEFLPPSSGPTPTYVSILKDGRSMCGICNKIFTKPSQLRLHVNIHYFERPFRCEACAVSFRTKGHLQKHQRSSSHLNKVNMNSTFGAPTTSNPRPFKCDDCKIAFRIHGHLAKHLRSKMHIMKLECGGKLPFGTYAELERCGYNLNDIDTTDCDNSLESLQLLAQKLYEKDPSKLGGWAPDMLPPSNNAGGSAGESSDEGDTMETEQTMCNAMPVHVK